MADKPPEKNGRFDTGLIRELAAILREADLGEIEIEHVGMSWRAAGPRPPSRTHVAQHFHATVKADAPQESLAAPARAKSWLTFLLYQGNRSVRWTRVAPVHSV